jgi:hypothetical protein
MATPRTRVQLRRGSDLALIVNAIEGTVPEASASAIGLAAVAELCRRHVLSHPGLDWNERRDQILMIGVEWDLERDTLAAQSDACLRSIARFLR